MKKLKWVMIVTLVLGIVLISACAEKEGMIMAQNGDTVKVHYTGTLQDGTVFDSSVDREPLSFTVGAGQMIEGFDKAVIGMKTGETKKVSIPAAQAYGEHEDTLVFVVDRKNIPPTMSPEVGDDLMMSTQSGGSVNVKVTEVTDSTITVDANHELAGKDLIFEITMVEIIR
jgi:peptidylprolyl isomerase